MCYELFESRESIIRMLIFNTVKWQFLLSRIQNCDPKIEYPLCFILKKKL